MGRRMMAVAVCVWMLVGGCGSDDGAAPGGGAQTTGGQGGGGAGGDCPVTVDELRSATSLSWTRQATRTDHPLETMESVKVTACVYTAPDKPQLGGDPLVLRVDVVDGKDSAAVRADFSSTCAEVGGAERDAAGGKVCDRDGTVVEGHTGDLVMVTLANADKDTAATLTPAIEKVLAAASS